MHFVPTTLFWFATFFLLVLVHELGHWLAGWIAGIPRKQMRIRLLAFPQYVALRNGERWVGPDELESYLAAMRRHLPTTPRLYLYTAGGMVLETAFTVIVSVTLLLVGLRKLAFVLAGGSLWLWVAYVLLMDLPMAIRRGHPWGDVSGMWWLARGPTLIFAVAMLGIRLFLVWAATR